MVASITKYCYNNESTKEYLQFLNEKSHFSEQALKSVVVENAKCVPDGGLFPCFSGGVFDRDNKPIKIAFQRYGVKTSQQLIEKTNIKEAKFVDKEVVYLGQLKNHWGHFIIDSISRLWFALQDPSKYTYVYLGTALYIGEEIHKNIYEFLRLFGIDKSQILYITKPTIFRKVIIPEMSYTPNIEWHREYLDTVYKVVDKVAEQKLGLPIYEKVYFSRSKFSKQSKTDYGEEQIERLFKRNGFQIIYPEEYSAKEQIFIVNNCKVFASVCGTCAHNVIFAKSRPKTILFKRMNGYQWHQWMLNEMAGLNPVTYVDSYWEPFRFIFNTTISGPYLYKLNGNVKKFVKDNNMVLVKSNIIYRLKVFLKYCFRVIHVVVANIKRKVIKCKKK